MPFKNHTISLFLNLTFLYRIDANLKNFSFELNDSNILESTPELKNEATPIKNNRNL